MQWCSLIKLYYFSLLLLLLVTTLTVSQKALSAENLSAQPLRIAVASNFTPALKKLLVEFHQQTQIDTQVISGATGALFLQIKHGAPFDMFIAADSIRPAQLEQQQRIVLNSRKTYALGQLALLSMDAIAKLSDLHNIPTHFAIADPETAPYGKAAKQTLTHLGLWQQYSANAIEGTTLIKGMNINQTFTQVRSQAVNSGLVANSQLVLNNLTGAIIPSHYHEPIAQQLVIMNNSKNITQATRLSEYLLSAEVQQKIVNFGYARFEDRIVEASDDKS